MIRAFFFHQLRADRSMYTKFEDLMRSRYNYASLPHNTTFPLSINPLNDADT